MARTRDDDACPGALTLHEAADGALARIRVPGGMLSAAQLETLAHCARDLGGGTLELTGRGNVQIRGITDADAVAHRAMAAGLLPSPSHERVRNVIASSLTGRLGGVADVRGLVAAFDAALCDDPGLAALPGRVLFGFDDGRGDVSGLGADLAVHLTAPDEAAVLLAGADTGVRVPMADAVVTLLDLARRFVAVRGTAWRVRELDDPAALLPDGAARAPSLGPFPAEGRPPIGWLSQDDGRVALGAGVPLGVLDAHVAEFVAAIGAPVVLTPWRSLVVCDLDEGVADVALRVLAPRGLIFDEASPLLAVSACTGSPGCAHSLADVRADALATARRGPAAAAGTHRHLVGCERACGSPSAGEVLVATGVDGTYRRRERP